MPRRTPPNRVADIARAACKVFTEKGYRRTLMTDIGRELGLSHAVLYRYVESKEALFQLALLYAIDPHALPDVSVPHPTPAPGEALRPLMEWTDDNSTFPLLQAALSTDRCDDIDREFREVVDELYSVIEDHHALLALIERSALDLPELESMYFGKARPGQVDQLEHYLERRRQAGLLRPFPDDSTATHFIVETVAWFAWHRRNDPSPPDIGDGEARTSVLYLLAAAFVPDELQSPAGADQ